MQKAGEYLNILKSYINLNNKTILNYVGVFFAIGTIFILNISFLFNQQISEHAGAAFVQDDNEGYFSLTFKNNQQGISANNNVSINTLLGIATISGSSTSGYITTQNIEPNSFNGRTNILLDGTNPANGILRVDLLDCSSSEIPGFTGFNINPNFITNIDISSLNSGTYPCIQVKTHLIKGISSPILKGIKINWIPKPQFQANIDIDSGGLVGKTHSVNINYSVNFVNDKEIVAYVTLPSSGNQLYTGNSQGQDASAIFVSASDSGEYTSSSLLVNGTTVPGNSVYRNIGTGIAGQSNVLSFRFKSQNGLQSGTQYNFIANIEGFYGAAIQSSTGTFTLRSIPNPVFSKSTKNTIRFENADRYYIPYSGLIIYDLSYKNTNTNYGNETIFNPTIVDDLTNIASWVSMNCAGGSVWPRIFEITPISSTGSTYIARNTGNIIPGGSYNVQFGIDLTGCTPGALINNVAFVTGDNINGQTGSHNTNSLSNIEGNSFTKTARSIDSTSSTIYYNDPFNFGLNYKNVLFTRYDHVVLFDKLPFGLQFEGVNAEGQSGLNYQVYYSQSGLFNDPTTPPRGGDYSFALSGDFGTDWSSGFDPNARWIAVYFKCVNSSFFPSLGSCMGMAENAYIKLRVRANENIGQECQETTYTNTGFFMAFSGSNSINNDDMDVVSFSPIHTGITSLSVDIKPREGVLSTSILSGNSEINVGDPNSYKVIISNNGIDTILSGSVVFELPQTLINGTTGRLDFVSTSGGILDMSQYFTGQVIVRFGSLAVGQRKEISITIKTPKGIINGSQTTINATISGLDDKCGLMSKHISKNITLNGNPSLSINKTVNQSAISITGELLYSLDFENFGNAVTQNTYIVDILPSGTQFLYALTSGSDSFSDFSCVGCKVYFADSSAQLPSSLSINNPFTIELIQQEISANNLRLGTESSPGVRTSPFGSNTKYVIFRVDNTLLGTPLLQINNSNNKVKIAVQNNTTPQGGTFSNSVGILADSIIQTISDDVTTNVFETPGLNIKIEAENDIKNACGDLYWYIDYRNDASDPDSVVSISTTLPNELTLLDILHRWDDYTVNTGGQSSGRFTLTNSQYTNSILSGYSTITFNAVGYKGSDLQPYEGGRLAVHTRIKCATPSNSYIEVTSNGQYSNGIITNYISDDYSILIKNPDLSITKNVDDTAPIQGQILNYTLTVSNEGSYEAENVMIEDVLPAGLCYVPGSTLILGPSGRTVGQPQVIGTCPGEVLVRSITGANTLTKSPYPMGTIPGINILGVDKNILITYQTTVQTVPNGSSLTNGVSISNSNQEDTIFGNTGAATSTIPYPDPTIFSVVADSTVLPGNSFDVKVNYQNNSKVCASGAYITFELPRSLSLTGAKLSSVSVDSGIVLYYNDSTTFPSFDYYNPVSSGWFSYSGPLSNISPIPNYLTLWLPNLLCDTDGLKSATFGFIANEDNTNLKLPAGMDMFSTFTIFASGLDNNPANNVGSGLTTTIGMDLSISVQGSEEGTFPGTMVGEPLSYDVTFNSAGSQLACKPFVDITLDPNLTQGVPFISPSTIQIYDTDGNPTSFVNSGGTAIANPAISTQNLGGGVIRLWFGNNGSDTCLPATAYGEFTINTKISNTIPDTTKIESTFVIGENGPSIEDTTGNNSDISSVFAYRADLMVSKVGYSFGLNGTNQTGGGDDNANYLNPLETVRYSISYNNIGNFDARDAKIEDKIPDGMCYKIGTLESNQPIGTTIEYRYNNGSRTGTAPTDQGGGVNCNISHWRLLFNSPIPAPANIAGEQQIFQGTSTNIQFLTEGISLINKGTLTGAYATGPVLPETIGLGNLTGYYFGPSSTFYEKGDWSACNPASINLIQLNPGTNVIPNSLTGNNIYLLNSGTYINSVGIRVTGTCTAIVGSGNVRLFSSAAIPSSASGMFYIKTNGTNRIIFDNLFIDGINNGVGGTHATNFNGILVAAVSTQTDRIYVNNIRSTNNTVGFNMGAATAYGGSGVVVNHSLFSGNSMSVGFGVARNTTVKNTTISNTFGVSFYAGIGIFDGDVQCQNSNNKFINLKIFNTEKGILSECSRHPIIENSQIYNNNYGMWHIGVEEAVMNNLLVYDNTYGFYMIGAAGVNPSPSFNTISNSHIFNNQYGYYMHVQGGSGAPFHLRGINNVIRNSRIYGNSTAGIYRQGNITNGRGSIILIDNEISNNLYGILNNDSVVPSFTISLYGTNYLYENNTNILVSGTPILSGSTATNQHLAMTGGTAIFNTKSMSCKDTALQRNIGYYTNLRCMNQGPRWSSNTGLVNLTDYILDGISTKQTIPLGNSGVTQPNTLTTNYIGSGSMFYDTTKPIGKYWDTENSYANSGFYASTVPISGTTISVDSWNKFIVDQNILDNTSIEYSVYPVDLSNQCIFNTGAYISATTLASNSLDISSIDPSIKKICLRFDFNSTDNQVTPKINSRFVSYNSNFIPTFFYDVRVKSTDLLGLLPSSTISNTVVSSTTSQEVAYGNNSSTYSMNLLEADLEITKTANKLVALSGNQITYTINYFNNGPSQANSVVITDFLPAYTTYITGTYPSTPTIFSSGGFSGVTLTLPSLPSNSGGQFTVTVQILPTVPSSGSSIINYVTIESNTFDPDLLNNAAIATTEIGNYANIYTTISCDPTASLSQNMNCIINFGNNGNETATGVVLTGFFDSNVSFVSATGNTGGCAFSSNSFSCSGVSPFTSMTSGINYSINVTLLLSGNINLLSGSNFLVFTSHISTPTFETYYFDNLFTDSTLVVSAGKSTIDGIVYRDLNLNSGYDGLSENLGIFDGLVFLIGRDIYGSTVGPDPILYSGVFTQYVSGSYSTTPYITRSPVSVTSNGHFSFGLLDPGQYLLVAVPGNGLTNYTSSGGVLFGVGNVVGSGTLQGGPNNRYVTGITIGDFNYIQDFAFGLEQTCGNNIVEPIYGEFCDDGAQNGNPGFCNATCSAVMIATDLSIIKTANVSTGLIGESVIYSLTYVNSGTNIATGVEVRDILPAGLTYISASQTPSAIFGQQVIFDLGNLNPGGTGQIDISVTINTGSTGGINIINTAQIDSLIFDTNYGDNIAIFSITGYAPTSDIILTKTPTGNTGYNPGSMDYTITYFNAGPNTANSLFIEDIFDGAQLADLGFYGDFIQYYPTPEGLMFEIGNVPVGTTGYIYGTMQILDSDIFGLEIANIVSGSSESYDPDTSTNYLTSTIMSFTPHADISIVKTALSNTGTVGGQVTYEFIYHNAGPQTGYNVDFSDMVLNGFAGFGGVFSGDIDGYVNAYPFIIFSKSIIPIGYTGVFYAVYDIYDGSISGTSTTNVITGASVSSYDPNPSNDSDEATILTFIPKADIIINKTSDLYQVTSGSYVNYTIDYQNNASNTGENVIIKDLFNSNYFDIISSSLGYSEMLDGTYFYGMSGDTCYEDLLVDTGPYFNGLDTVLGGMYSFLSSNYDGTYMFFVEGDSCQNDILNETGYYYADLEALTIGYYGQTLRQYVNSQYRGYNTPQNQIGEKIKEVCRFGYGGSVNFRQCVSYLFFGYDPSYLAGTCGVQFFAGTPTVGESFVQFCKEIGGYPNTEQCAAAYGFNFSSELSCGLLKDFGKAGDACFDNIVNETSVYLDDIKKVSTITYGSTYQELLRGIVGGGVSNYRFITGDVCYDTLQTSYGLYFNDLTTYAQGNGYTDLLDYVQLNINAGAVAGDEGMEIINYCNNVAMDPNLDSCLSTYDPITFGSLNMAANPSCGAYSLPSDEGDYLDDLCIAVGFSDLQQCIFGLFGNGYSTLFGGSITPNGLDVSYYSQACGISGSIIGIERNIGNISPFATGSINLNVQIKGGVVNIGSGIDNYVTGTTTTYDINLANNESTATVTYYEIADLEVTKNVDLSVVDTEDSLVYTINYSNNGPFGSSGITITDAIPNELTLISFTGNFITGYTSGSDLIFEIGSLLAGGSGEISVNLDVNGGVSHLQTITNIAYISGEAIDTITGNNYGSAVSTIFDDVSPLILSSAYIPPSGIRTSGTVILILTGSEEIKITGFTGNIAPTLSGRINDTVYGYTKTIEFADNWTGTIFFEDGVGNTGSFEVLVDWIDRTPTPTDTIITPSYLGGGIEFITVNLSGYNSGFNGYGYNTIDDDIFVIYAFSGVSSVNLSGFSTGTDTFTLTKSLVFLDNRTGTILFRDKAGNTGTQSLNITGIVPITDVEVKIGLSYRISNDFTINANTIFFISDGIDYLTGDTFPKNMSFNSNGTGTLYIVEPANGSGIKLKIKPDYFLSNYITGTYSGQTMFDYTQFSNKPGYLYYLSNSYFIAGDVDNNNSINSLDLVLINENLSLGSNSYYSVGDINKDGYITSFDQSIVLKHAGENGY